ncbi:ribokinase [Microbacterium keratanolyticum]|uniref:Ribokinase n=1 Tax=Microbacterium keratanolyticum TaxID=67574 RepID=A0A9W6HRT6_9MICO|nr:ribokinase [Microbacterium keratanolyticum]MBM7468838.1 ribokinase [Microbacterium keratanolyticum]GLK00915.1 ribokinase [Microbacterium keratanolyticum]
MTGRVVVCGSLNADVTFAVERIPVVGETTVASGTARSSGGKGANQAYAAARTARTADVLMVGAVGADEAGDVLRAELAAAGVDTSLVRRVDAPTGQAFIAVDAEGGNIIVVAPGANLEWSTDEQPPLAADDTVVLQLEIPLAAVARIATQARGLGARVVLNAAPAVAAAQTLLDAVDILVVNEPEAEELLGLDAKATAEISRSAARLDLDIVVTRGSDSTLLATRDGELTEIPTLSVSALDTVGAGDAFVGTLVAAIAEGHSLPEAARRASAAGAATVTVRGARHPDLSPALLDQMLS